MDIVSYALSKKFTKQVAATKADIVNGKVPSSQLPSYVDDVVEYADITTFPEEGEAGKIYVALDTGYTYRWTGTDYIQIGGQDLSDIVTNFAANYDDTATYNVGDFCTHENVFYVCAEDIQTAEAWTPAHWTRTTIATVVEALKTEIAAKQDTLVSGTNIKTVAGKSVVGAGNVEVTKSDVGLGNVDNTSDADKPVSTATQSALNAKQDSLVSGTNIKTINSQSLLGSGNIDTTPTALTAAEIETLWED